MRIAAALLCAVVVVVTGCGSGEPPSRIAEYRVLDRPAALQELRRHIDQFPRTIDPSLSTDESSRRIIEDLFEGLLRLDPAGQVVPGVAASWDSSADGLRWVFNLRPDARWSNGELLTAADFVYAWRRTVDPRTASASAQSFAPLLHATQIIAGSLVPETLGVRALDAHRLEVQLQAPTAYFPWLLTNPFFFPLPRSSVEQSGERWTRPENLVGNGAFVLREYRVGGSITLAKNPFYWDAAGVRLTKVTYYALGDRSAATSRFLAGDFDMTDSFAAEDIGWLRARLGAQVVIAPFLGTLMFAVHVGRPPFSSKRLRQALSMALDRDILARYVLKDVYLPAWNMVPPLPGYPAVLPDWARLPRAQRHDEARELYALAGYSAQRPLRVELVYPTSSPDIRRLMEALAAMWRTNLGAEVQIYNEEWRVLQQNRSLGKHALFWYSWIGDYPDPLTFMALFQRDNGQNFGAYANRDYDALVGAAASVVDPATRVRDFTRAEALLNDDAPFIPIYFYTSRHLLKPYLRGWQSNALDRHLSRDLYLLAREPLPAVH
jgi:oligopeptide transport system substrate-binding protein